MPFKCDTFRVFIASPADLAEERHTATDAVHEWNAQHAAAEGVMLLPVKWETHATPTAGARPQAAINAQLVAGADILIGMFWTKLGTTTGVAPSGTVEEIDQCVAAGKPTMLYFSKRLIEPGSIDIAQLGALREFKEDTYKSALCGEFSDEASLRAALLRDLMSQVRKLKPRRRRRADALDEAERWVSVIEKFKKAKVTPSEYHRFRDDFLGPKTAPSAPAITTHKANITAGQKGPNGFPIQYLRNGDLAEMIVEGLVDGEDVWPMLLRRNDNAVYKAIERFSTVIWYDRKLVMIDRMREGQEEPLQPDIEAGMRKGMAEAEKKYGKQKIRQYYKDDFGWGMLNGKLSALRWVMGDDWDMLDT